MFILVILLQHLMALRTALAGKYTCYIYHVTGDERKNIHRQSGLLQIEVYHKSVTTQQITLYYKYI